MIYHPVADALTGDEARAVVASLLQVVEALDEHGQAKRLHCGLLNTVRLAERLAGAADGCTGQDAVEIAMQRVAA